MKSLVIYDSVFGNTEKIAKAIGEGIDAQVVRVNAVKQEDLAGVELLLVGSPTRGFRPTEGMKKFLKDLPSGSLKGVGVGGFDTRMDVDEVDNKILTFLEKIFGYAAEPITKTLVQKGGRQIIPPAGFIVKASEGPLRDGELERAREWGKEAAKKSRLI
jgi:flavodoxin